MPQLDTKPFSASCRESRPFNGFRDEIYQGERLQRFQGLGSQELSSKPARAVNLSWKLCEAVLGSRLKEAEEAITRIKLSLRCGDLA